MEFAVYVYGSDTNLGDDSVSVYGKARENGVLSLGGKRLYYFSYFFFFLFSGKHKRPDRVRKPEEKNLQCED